MAGMAKLTAIEARLYLRRPEAFFFTLLFPMLLVLVFGGIWGNKPTPFFGGRGMVDASTPAYIGIIIGSTALLGISISVGTDRERGVLRRYRATPLRPAAVLVANVIVHFGMTLAGSLLLIATARAVFGLRFGGNAAAVLFGFTLSALSFFAVGFLLASVAPTSRSAYVIGMALYFPNIFLSGATFPAPMFPPLIRTINRAFPMTHVVRLLQGLWFGEPLASHGTDVLVLAAMLVAGTALSAALFRWE